MRRPFLLLTRPSMAAGLAFPQYKLEPAGPPPDGVPAAIAGTLQKEGSKIVGGNGAAFCEVWFRSAAPSGPKSAEDGVTLPTIPQGALIGVLRFPGRGADRRGQNIKPGPSHLSLAHPPLQAEHHDVTHQRACLVL